MQAIAQLNQKSFTESGFAILTFKISNFRFFLGNFFMVIGLTGAIGGGKSAALRAFMQCGAKIVDSDKLCHKYYENSESKIFKRLVERWGERILSTNGNINRSVVGEIVFSNPLELEFLTALIYPVLEQDLGCLIDDNLEKELLVIEIPLLFEFGWERRVDVTVALWTERALRHQRAVERGLCYEDILEREKKQMNDEIKIEKADYVIVNNGSLDLLTLQCKKIINSVMKGF